MDYNGVKIEVKSSAYLQTWYQSKLSNIRFSISKSKAWDPKSNTYEDTPQRQSDYYIFCLLHHQVQETLNPLDLEQWTFYIIKTNALDAKCGEASTISLSRLERMGAIKCKYDEIKVILDRLVCKCD